MADSTLKCITLQNEKKVLPEGSLLFLWNGICEMSSYKQLTSEQRCLIEVLNKSGFSQQVQPMTCDQRGEACSATKMRPAVLTLIGQELPQR